MWMRTLLTGAALGSLLALIGCADGRPPLQPILSDAAEPTDEVVPPSRALLELVLPQEIEIQRNFTKPVSFAKDGTFDGVEVLLAARDDFGDAAKCVGTVLIELYSTRPAASDRAAGRVALWSVQIDSRDRMIEYYDRFSRLHRFPVQLEGGTLVPGKYLLRVSLVRPDERKLFAEQELTVPATPAQPGKRR